MGRRETRMKSMQASELERGRIVKQNCESERVGTRQGRKGPAASRIRIRIRIERFTSFERFSIFGSHKLTFTNTPVF